MQSGHSVDTDQPQVGWGALIFSYKHRLGPFFWVPNFEFQFLWVFRKIIIVLGRKILWIFFGGHHKIGLYLVVFPMYLGSWYRMEDTFLSC